MSNANSSGGGKIFGLSAAAAIGACAVCCAVPFLVTAGIGGGIAAAVAGCIRPGAELALAGVVGVAIAGVMAYRARTRSAMASATHCDVSDGCGCSAAGKSDIFSTPAPRPGEPIVCTADLSDQITVQGQLDGYRAVFEHLLRTERFDGGVRWVFARQPGLELELRTLAEKEHRCCSFFKYDLRRVGDTITWETRANPDAESVLVEFARLPERLAANPRGNETQSIKESISNVGLKFAADAPVPK
ncbi:MAG TPA: hypothetical protein VER96_29425 [Polyangiaceae bacterium]|nr:hypothetical protein [Polyangiaceae bacterium]